MKAASIQSLNLVLVLSCIRLDLCGSTCFIRTNEKLGSYLQRPSHVECVQKAKANYPSHNTFQSISNTVSEKKRGCEGG
jgi:hypothetical protein